MSESLSFYVQRYFMSYLMKQHNYGANTISSYRDTFKLLYSFMANTDADVSRIVIDDISHDKVIEFMTWLGETRKNGVSTKNVRLAHIKSFFRYVMMTAPEHSDQCRKVLCIPFGKEDKKPPACMSKDAIRQMLAENGKEHTNFWFQLESAMRSLLNNTIGMGFSDIVWWLHMLPLMLLLIAAFMLPIMYLFRQSAPIKKMVQRVKAIPTGIKKWQLRSFSMWLKRVDPMTIFMLLIVLAVMVLIADKIPFYFGYAVRYLYMVMPLMITVMISCLYWLVKRFKAGKLLLTLFCLCPIVTNLCGMTLPPYMTYQNTLSMSTVLRGNNVVVLTYDRTNYDQYSPYAYELCETDHVFFTSLEDYDVYIDAINTMPSDEELDVLIYYVDTKEDERGRYIIGDLVAGKNGERRKIYCEDILSRFQAQGQPEYVGEYHFVEGSFLIYRFS